MTDTLREIEIWHERARPAPTAENFSVQLGCHFEEVAEMLECINFGNEEGDRVMSNIYDALCDLSSALKAGNIKVLVDNRTEFLDSLSDQVVTAVGVAHCAGMNMTEACKRVNASNWSKFVDGQPVFNEAGKIKKGPDYVPPDLRGLV